MKDFSNWYESGESTTPQDLKKWKQQGLTKKESFRRKWPLNDLKQISIVNYVQGLSKAHSFCYDLEFGYENLYMSIKGGTAGKLGIYYSPKFHEYHGDNNKVINPQQLENEFEHLKFELLEILNAGLKNDFSVKCFDPYLKKANGKKLNRFSSKPAMITKLLCIYSDEKQFSGINLRSDEEDIWSKFVTLENDNYILQNYLITKMISEKYPDLNGNVLSKVLVDYRDRCRRFTSN